MLDFEKQQLCSVAKRAQSSGLCKHRSGNFSTFDPASALLAVTPTGLDREEMSPRDIVLVDLDGRVVEAESGLRPTSEVLMHIELYRNRPDLRGIAHTHSPIATSFAVLGRPLPAVVYEVANMGLSKARVPIAAYARPGTPELAENVGVAAQEADCVLLEKHGAVAMDDRNVYEALLKAAYIEELAELYYRTLTIGGGEPPTISEEEMAAWEYPQQIVTSK